MYAVANHRTGMMVLVGKLTKLMLVFGQMLKTVRACFFQQTRRATNSLDIVSGVNADSAFSSESQLLDLVEKSHFFLRRIVLNTTMSSAKLKSLIQNPTLGRVKESRARFAILVRYGKQGAARAHHRSDDGE
jgi:hypothetical protein